MNQLKDGNFEVIHRSRLDRDCDYLQQYLDNTSTAPISDDDAQLLSVNLSDFSSREDHNLFREALDSNSDNDVEIIHVQPAIPSYDDHDSELEEKKEAVPSSNTYSIRANRVCTTVDQRANSTCTKSDRR